MIKRYLHFLAIVIVAQSLNFFTLNRLPTTNGARCLDGSPAAIYIY